MHCLSALVAAISMVASAGPAFGGGYFVMAPMGVGLSEVAAVSQLGQSRQLSATNAGWARDVGSSLETSPGAERIIGVVRDNPALSLVAASGQPTGGIFLVNATSGDRKRIDSDSLGAPLVPSWTGTDCTGNDSCVFSDQPRVAISEESISQDGRIAAFCANYAIAIEPVLYVKDLVSGQLTRTSVRCGVRRTLVEDDPLSESFDSAQVSDDGRVVHVSGDLLNDETGRQTGWQRDLLYSTKTGKVRLVNGHGTMTRDGRTIFLRMGARRVSAARLAPKKVGAYSVASGRTKLLTWWNTYFDDHYLFGVPRYRMNRSGRYLVNNYSVLDRNFGVSVDIGSILRERGYEFSTIVEISNDGMTIFSDVLKRGPVLGDPYEVVTISNWGWQPMARATVSSKYGQGTLFVDVDPNKASGYWTFKVHRQSESGDWQTLPGTYRTQGAKETRRVNLPPGTYRIRVNPKYGYRGYTSTSDTLYGP